MYCFKSKLIQIDVLIIINNNSNSDNDNGHIFIKIINSEKTETTRDEYR